MNINEINELALNSTTCIRTASNIGETIVTNICTGEITTVPWGSFDMLSFYGLIGLIGLMALIVLPIVACMFRDIFRGY